MSKYPDSKHKAIQKINRLVYEAFPPKKKGDAYAYGKLYFLSDSSFYLVESPKAICPMWMLDGMTPVGVTYVLTVLRDRGFDISPFAHITSDIVEVN